jgi:anti-sigma factor RsiW
VTAAHLDYEELADFAEGILDDAKATSTEEHLAHCDDCRRRAAEVAQVSRVLARAPTPPMPAHLVDRLDAALAAEAASHVPAHRHHRRFQFIAAAAAAVVLVGGGAAAVRTVMDDGGSNGAADTRPPMADRTHSVGPRAGSGAAPFLAVHSGTSYDAAHLDSQVPRAMSKSLAVRPRAVEPEGAALGGCVSRVSGGSVPLFVDSATYEGRTATVIVLVGTDKAHVDVWVVGGRCSASDPDVIAHRQIVR